MMTDTLRGLVLAGGYSRRMGRDKALIDYHGQPQGLRAFELLQEHCMSVSLSCRPGQFEGSPLEGLPEIHDLKADQGPMEGLRSAMLQFPEDTWFQLACDLPRVDQDLLQLLRDQQDPEAVVTCYRDPESGLPEPMCGMYRPAFLSHLEDCLAQGQRCARKSLMTLGEGLQLLDLPHPDAMCNVNRPEDWKPE